MFYMMPITTFENKYAITCDGRVYSLPRKDKFGRKFGGIFLKHRLDKYGYPVVHLTTTERKQVTVTIHKLVAETYIPNPNNKPTINHKDGNKQNNHACNLEWATYKENTQHGWNIGLCKAYDRTKPYNRQGIIESNKRRRKCGI